MVLYFQLVLVDQGLPQYSQEVHADQSLQETLLVLVDPVDLVVLQVHLVQQDLQILTLLVDPVDPQVPQVH